MRRSEDGVTLVEMLTATMIVTIVLGVVSGALYTVSKSEKMASQRSDSQSSNRQGFELLTRLLRQATYPAQSTYKNSTIVSYAAPDRIVFTSRRGAAVSAVAKRYEFALVDGDLIWGSSAATCVGSAPCTYSAPSLDRTAARWIRNAVGGGPCPGAPADGAIFRYYSASAANGGALTALTMPGSGYLTGAQLATVASVGVELHTDVIPNRPAPGCEAITGLVVLRNRVLT
jgi:Tfp pilus assembly protein PilW